MDHGELKQQIEELKKERNAVIVAHNYQRDEVQDVADVIGDSFALSKYCASSPHDTIVFCGVHFMAESAKILSPHKTVLLPVLDAGCPMADMVTADDVRKAKKRHPHAAVVCYINTSAVVKAECDVCCTSSNALQVIKSVEEGEILFFPDRNLGNFIAAMVPEKRMIVWDGFCITHHQIMIDDVIKARETHPDALLLIHPECQPEVAAMADFVGSTKQIIDFSAKSRYSKFIIGTEMGILFGLKRDNPDKEFVLLSQELICPNMKKTGLQEVYDALKNMRYPIDLDEGIMAKARSSLDRMLATT